MPVRLAESSTSFSTLSMIEPVSIFIVKDFRSCARESFFYGFGTSLLFLSSPSSAYIKLPGCCVSITGWDWLFCSTEFMWSVPYFWGLSAASPSGSNEPFTIESSLFRFAVSVSLLPDPEPLPLDPELEPESEPDPEPDPVPEAILLASSSIS